MAQVIETHVREPAPPPPPAKRRNEDFTINALRQRAMMRRCSTMLLAAIWRERGEV